MSLNSMRVGFGHHAKWVMGIMFFAMVAVTFSWNGMGRNPGGAASTQSPDDVVAKVDGQEITRGQYDQSLEMMEQYAGSGGVTMQPMIRHFVLQGLERDNEELAKAKSMGITATDAEIANMRDQRLREMNARKILGLPDSANLSDVDAALQQQGKSLDMVVPEAQARQDVILKKLEDRVRKSVVVSEQDTRNSYIQYHTRHILIDAQKRSDAQAQLLAKQVIAKATAPGAKFADLAKKYSEDFGTKNKGGDDGWIDETNGQLPPEFKKAAFALKPGQVTPDPVKSPSYNGYFIIKLEATRSNLPADFDKNKAKYISDYAKSKQDQAWQDFMQQLQQAPHNLVMIDPGLKGDQEMQDAQDNAMDPTKQQASYRAAIADYQKAIKATTNGRDKATYYLQIATADEALKDTAGETAAYEAASKSGGSPDPQLLKKLGDLYKQQGQNDKAVAAYSAASKSAWNDVPTHQTLAADFDALGHKDLGDKERAWIVDYNKRHPAPKNGATMAGGGQPISITPTAGNAGGAQPVAVAATPAKPATQEFAVTKTNGKVKVTPVKPVQ